MEGVDGIETAQFLSAAAFVLLRLTGRIDEPDRALALEALAFLAALHPDPVVDTQHADLARWRNPA